MTDSQQQTALRRIRVYLAIIITGLILSGVTAFPLVHETAWLVRVAGAVHLDTHTPALFNWLTRVRDALADTSSRYPFLAYGTDWLAFAHLCIAAAFIGPWQDPVRNKWVLQWAALCCLGVPLLAFGAGPTRGIPFFWRLIDCSFGLFCGLALIPLLKLVKQLERSR